MTEKHFCGVLDRLRRGIEGEVSINLIKSAGDNPPMVLSLPQASRGRIVFLLQVLILFSKLLLDQFFHHKSYLVNQ